MNTRHYSYLGLLILLCSCRVNYGEDSGAAPLESSGGGQEGEFGAGSAPSVSSPGTATSSSNGTTTSGASPVEECPADPCASKACGESCSICYFCSNGSCATDSAVRICNPSGECVLDPSAVAECPRDFEPCAGKQCGDSCDLCPEGADCPTSLGLCNALGLCELGRQPTCAQPSGSVEGETPELPNTDAGDTVIGGQGSTSEHQLSDERQYFEPGCGEGSPTAPITFVIEPGYYTPCEVEGEACSGGGLCRQVSINPCVCTGDVCCDACGRMQALCLSLDAGIPVEAGSAQSVGDARVQ